MPDEALLLDTHVWFWLAEAIPGKLSPTCLARIRAASQDGEILISAISVWEVAILEAKARVLLSTGCHEWVRAALRGPGIELVELSPEIAIDSTRLPGGIHGDPADRILVATARQRNATLVTADRAILKYARSGHVRAADSSSQAAFH
jgi:PIN domain nuclease of toxin-antitoxin system